MNFIDRFESYIVSNDNYELVLDLIECVIRTRISILSKLNGYYKFINDEILIKLIEELNKRFLYAGVGYQYENDEIIRIDHQYVHKEIVKPALEIIHNKAFEKVNEEYSNAHKHYRNQYIKDCIVACNRAFESLLKSICNECEWEYDPNNRASDLIKIIHKNGLFPVGMEKTIDNIYHDSQNRGARIAKSFWWSRQFVSISIAINLYGGICFTSYRDKYCFFI